jgi:hypothetical protein
MCKRIGQRNRFLHSAGISLKPAYRSFDTVHGFSPFVIVYQYRRLRSMSKIPLNICYSSVRFDGKPLAEQ